VKPPEIKTDPSHPVPASAAASVWSGNRKRQARRAGGIACLVLLAAVFANPLVSLFGYAASTTLFSYILCIPFCSGYLIYIQRKALPREYGCSARWALFPLVSGLAAWFAGSGKAGLSCSPVDCLALQVFSLVCFLTAVGFLFLGRKWMAAAAFPVSFLLFVIPLPDGVLQWLETSLQFASAEAADLLFRTIGTPFFRDGVSFYLPGYSIEVAQECSGIQASWILFVSTVLASYLFLKSPWRRTVLILAVIPLGIIRNGFRIVTIGLLCVHVGPHMIDHPIHRKGGPLFLAVSLIPLSILVWWLRRGELSRRSLPSQLTAKPPATDGR
jgi:exosortase C (VPDSG-CTERM-specific)